MKKIGIVAHGGLFTTELTNEDRYYFGNNYNKRIAQCGGLPLGLLPSDGELNEKAFDQCDALLISGGNKLWPYHFQAVHHAVKTGKKLLSICLGMQTTNQYFLAVEAAEKTAQSRPPLPCFTPPGLTLALWRDTATKSCEAGKNCASTLSIYLPVA